MLTVYTRDSWRLPVQPLPGGPGDIIDIMAQLVVRNLDDSVKERLRRAAAAHGHSMEEEARVILTTALSNADSTGSTPQHVGLGEHIQSLFAGNHPPEEFFTALEEIRRGSDMIIVEPRAIDLE